MRWGFSRRPLTLTTMYGEGDGIGVWNLCGDPNGQYTLQPGRDEDVLELFRLIRGGRGTR